MSPTDLSSETQLLTASCRQLNHRTFPAKKEPKIFELSELMGCRDFCGLQVIMPFWGEDPGGDWMNLTWTLPQASTPPLAHGSVVSQI